MKKTKLLISLLTLFTLTGTLQSCDQEKVFDPGIADEILIETPKDSVIVGTVIDLDDYVKVLYQEKEVKNYTAILTTENTAKLEGKKLTITAEGTVNVRIIYGDKNARFYVQAISELKARFIERTANIGKAYYVDNIVETESNVQLSGKGAIHNRLYFSVCYDPTIFGSSADGSWTGLIKTHKGYTYEFSADDAKGSGLTVHSGVVNDLASYSINADFPLDPAKFTTVNGKDGDYLVSYDLSLTDNWIYASNGLIPALNSDLALDKIGLKIEYEDILGVDGETIEDVMLVTTFYYGDVGGETISKDNPKTYIKNAVLFDKEYTSIAVLNDYIDNREQPAKLKATALVERFDEIVTAKTYTMDTKCSYKHTDGSPYSTAPDDSFPQFNYQTFVNPTAVWNDFGLEGYYGTVEKDTGLYYVTNVSDNGTELLDTPSVTKEENPLANNVHIWNDFSSVLVTSISSKNLMNSLNVFSIETSGTTTTYTVGYNTSEDFFTNCLYLVPLHGEAFVDFFNQLYQGVVLMSYLNCNITITDTYINIDLSLNLTTDVVYHIEHTFYDVGVDKITDKISGLTFA